jgi:putative PIN family toxin of toxin-antitoxin system
MMSSTRFVVDTNTLVSAALIEGSTPDRAIRRTFRNGALLASPDILDEATEVLTREEFDQYASWERRHELLEALADQSTVVEPTVAVDVCRDPADNKFLELAVEGDADLIISGDSDLLVLHPFEGISILSPAGFLASKWA